MEKSINTFRWALISPVRMEQGDFLSVGSSTLFYELQSASPLLPARWPNGLAGPPLDLQVQHNPVVQSTSASGYNRY